MPCASALAHRSNGAASQPGAAPDAARRRPDGGAIFGPEPELEEQRAAGRRGGAEGARAAESRGGAHRSTGRESVLSMCWSGPIGRSDPGIPNLPGISDLEFDPVHCPRDD